jgi:large subunit ribosomal protein L21e
MVKNSKGTLSGNTRKLKGRMNLTVCDQVKTFQVGAKVVIRQRAAPAGQPHMRYKGRHGTIVEKRGGCYVIKIRDGGMEKKLIASPIHLIAA